MSLSLNRATVFALICLVYTLVTTLVPFILPHEVLTQLVQEDNIIEYFTFLAFTVSSLAWLGAFAWSGSGDGHTIWRWHTRRNYIYLLLALLLFFGAGEEISWGQRILGFETPAEIADINAQDEFTVHNLQFFHYSVDNPLRMERLFIYSWFTLGILIPLSALLSQRLRGWFSRVGIPVVPLVLGSMFLVNYGWHKLHRLLLDKTIIGEVTYDRIREIEESQHALVLALIAIYILVEIRQRDTTAT